MPGSTPIPEAMSPLTMRSMTSRLQTEEISIYKKLKLRGYATNPNHHLDAGLARAHSEL